MTHRRQTLRDLVVTHLTGLSLTGSNVFAHRVYAHVALPSINVVTLAEEIGDDLRARSCTLDVQVRAKASAALDVQLDDIAEDIEAALETDWLLDGDGVHLVYQGFDTELDDTEDNPTALMTMHYRLLYQFNPTA